MNKCLFFRFTFYASLAAFISPLMASQPKVYGQFHNQPSTVMNTGAEPGIGQGKEKLPLWEAGLIAVAYTGPIYPSADVRQEKLIPLPYLIYRGDTIRLGEGSMIKAVAVEKETFKFDLSLGVAFDASSDDSEVRKGMPDLDFLFEIGPQASFLINGSEQSETWLNLQLRSVFSTDFSSVSQRGYVFEPEIAYKGHDILFANSTLYFSISPLFASAKTHKYFYQVDAEYAMLKREEFEAEAGYLGTQIQLANRFQLRDDLTMFFGVNLGVWSKSKNEDSPLYQQNATYAFAVGVKWNLFES